MNDDKKQEVFKTFQERMTMTPAQLKKWLETDESQSVGIEQGTKNEAKSDSTGGESIGHDSGHKIVDILQKNKNDLTEDDYAHMQKVNGYIARHAAQKPTGDLTHTRWRYSLMNWGHDPLREM